MKNQFFSYGNNFYKPNQKTKTRKQKEKNV